MVYFDAVSVSGSDDLPLDPSPPYPLNLHIASYCNILCNCSPKIYQPVMQAVFYLMLDLN